MGVCLSAVGFILYVHRAKIGQCKEVDNSPILCPLGNLYMRLDTHRDGWHSFPISNTWKEVSGDVDAVFTYDGKVYIIKVTALAPVSGRLHSRQDSNNVHLSSLRGQKSEGYMQKIHLCLIVRTLK